MDGYPSMFPSWEYRLEESRMTFQAELHDRLRRIAVAWVAWLEAHARLQEEDEEVDDDDDDDLLITYNEQGLIRFTRPRTE